MNTELSTAQQMYEDAKACNFATMHMLKLGAAMQQPVARKLQEQSSLRTLVIPKLIKGDHLFKPYVKDDSLTLYTINEDGDVVNPPYDGAPVPTFSTSVSVPFTFDGADDVLQLLAAGIAANENQALNDLLKAVGLGFLDIIHKGGNLQFGIGQDIEIAAGETEEGEPAFVAYEDISLLLTVPKLPLSQVCA